MANSKGPNEIILHDWKHITHCNRVICVKKSHRETSYSKNEDVLNNSLSYAVIEFGPDKYFHPDNIQPDNILLARNLFDYVLDNARLNHCQYLPVYLASIWITQKWKDGIDTISDDEPCAMDFRPYFHIIFRQSIVKEDMYQAESFIMKLLDWNICKIFPLLYN